MSEIIKIQKDGQVKPITQVSWDLMGENKNGWSLMPENNQIVSDETKQTPPPTGDAAKIPSKKVDNSSVKNEAKKKAPQIVSDETKQTEETKTPTEPVVESNSAVKASEEFATVANDIKRNNMMDFLDINEVGYKSSAADEELVDLLAAYLKNDVTSLKNSFGL